MGKSMLNLERLTKMKNLREKIDIVGGKLYGKRTEFC